MTPVTLPATAPDDIKAFLQMWDAPSDADLRLWLAVLQPVGDGLVDLLAAWLRSYELKPHPRKLLVFYAVRKSTLPMREIAEPIMLECGVTLEELRGAGKTARLFKPRQRIMCALYEKGFTQDAIGQFLNRDHSTVTFAIKKGMPK
jgi:hypothetical protein